MIKREGAALNEKSVFKSIAVMRCREALNTLA